MEEHYPTQNDILECIKNQAIIVGSFAKNPENKPKDIDIVISPEGLENLLDKYRFYLCPESVDTGWWLYIPMEDSEPVIEIFRDKSSIENKTRWNDRVTFDETKDLPQHKITLYGVEMNAIV